MKTKKVLVAMSGGVDSSVAAFLLKDKGFDVIGVTMVIRENTEECSLNKSCCSPDDIIDARRVASQLKISFQTINLIKNFKKEVIDYFCEQYLEGLTPNPCIICNEKLKFGHLLDYAKKHGIDYVATGHYARNSFDKKANRFIIKKGLDRVKDQSYVLFSLTQEQLKHIIFPLGRLKKEEVRNIAKKNGLIVAEKSESQEICFIPDNDYPKFIREQFPEEKKGGLILDNKGKALGKHKGIYNYTVGQRKGLGIASPHPLYVVKIDKEKNEIVAGKDGELYQKELIAEKVNWIAIESLKNPVSVKAKIRYKTPEEKAAVYPLGKGQVRVKFDKSQRAITPGQAVVLYDRDKVVGGGWITKS